MQKTKINLLMQLWSHFEQERRSQFVLLLVLMCLVSCVEIISIGIVLPFLTVLTAPERIYDMQIAKPYIEALKITEPKQLILLLSLGLGIATLLTVAMRLLLIWASGKVSFAAGADLGNSIYRRTLYQPYSVHCSRNSSEIISGISIKGNDVIYNIIMPVLTIISSSILLFIILIIFLVVQPVIALIVFGGGGIIYIMLITLTQKKIMKDSECVANNSTKGIKSLQEGLGGIREIIINASQEAYCKNYQNVDSNMRKAQVSSLFIRTSPRYALEAIAMLIIIGIVYSESKHPDGVTKAIPILGAMVLIAQRLLPVLQQAYTSWIQVSSSQASLNDVLNLLEQPLNLNKDKLNKKIQFEKNISLKNIEFQYEKKNKIILDKINLNITKGRRIGLIGMTGSGKTTLVDIIMGLHWPTGGEIEVDGKVLTSENIRGWQLNISHVPQSIYLTDNTIAENIAFGVDKSQINILKVKQVAKQAQISSTIESLPNQYQTLIGERGIRLSGGQRQRIGIARALYKEASVIIFDEATSALDSETERELMEEIEKINNDITLIIIAHRMTTLNFCNQIYELKNGHIKEIK
jgi:ABC-type multidrug transport system fused ATPase/permease subunit